GRLRRPRGVAGRRCDRRRHRGPHPGLGDGRPGRPARRRDECGGPLMLRLTLTQMRSAAPRLVAAGLAILLGTAFVTATLLASSVMERTTYNAVTAQYADADLVVSGGMTTKTLEQIRDLDGVAAADAMAQTGVELSNGSRSEFTIADATASDPSLEHSDVADGSLPSSTDGVAVSEGTAQRLGVRPGDEITLTAAYWPAAGDSPTKEFSLQVTGM